MSLSIKDFCLRVSNEVGVPIRMVWTSVLDDAGPHENDVVVADGMIGPREILFKEAVQYYGIRRPYSAMSSEEKIVSARLSTSIVGGPVLFVETLL